MTDVCWKIFCELNRDCAVSYTPCRNANEGLWNISLSLYYIFTAKSVGERISNVGQPLAKLAAKIQ